MTTAIFNVRSVANEFLRPESILDPYERAAVRVLTRFGGKTRRIVQQRQRKGRYARASEYPEELRALLGLGRDPKTGRFTSGINVTDIQPKPKISADPAKDQSPRYFSKLLRKHTYFVVDKAKLSVLTGTARLPGQTPADTPEMLEEGGLRTQLSGGEWVVIYQGGQPSKVRLARRVRKPVRYKGHRYVETSHATALDANMPQMWKDSIT